MTKKAALILLLPAIIISFLIGSSLGSTGFSELTKGVKLTGIISSSFTVAGFSLAFLTYSQWLTNKRRDDSYRVAKDYIAALNENQEIIREINFHYSHLCPAPGVAIESETVAKKRIEHLYVLQDNLSLARVHLSIANSELAFWKVKLSPSFSEQHNIVIKDLSNIVTVMVGLNSQLYLMFADDCENSKEVISHKKTFDKYVNSVTSIINSRLTQSFEEFFIFE